MPFKPVASKYDYPETYSNYPKDPSWIATYQKERLRHIIGNEFLLYLESKLKEENKEYCEWCDEETHLIWVESHAPYSSEDQGIGHWECFECRTWAP